MKWNKQTKNEIIKEKDGYVDTPTILKTNNKIETNYGLEIYALTNEHLEALKEGKALHFDINGDEYAVLMFLQE